MARHGRERAIVRRQDPVSYTHLIVLAGDEGSQTVSVTVGTDVCPLPLLDAGAALLGMTEAGGNLHLETTVSLPAQPAWVDGAEAGRDPAGWIGAWLR